MWRNGESKDYLMIYSSQITFLKVGFPVGRVCGRSSADPVQISASKPTLAQVRAPLKWRGRGGGGILSDLSPWIPGRSVCHLPLFWEITSDVISLGTMSEISLSAATANPAESGGNTNILGVC